MRRHARFGAALVLALLGGLLVAPATPATAAPAGIVQGATPTFTDVAGSAFAADIDWLVAQNVTTGYPDHTFRPTGAVTRQAFAAFLFRLDGQTGGGPCVTAAPFSDVPAASMFCTEITWLVGKGITAGYATSRLTPIKVPGLGGIKAISAGCFHSMALASDGSVYTWDGMFTVGWVTGLARTGSPPSRYPASREYKLSPQGTSTPWPRPATGPSTPGLQRKRSAR